MSPDRRVAGRRSRRPPGLREIVRTAGALGGTLGGFGLGLAIGTVRAAAGTRTRRDAVDLGTALAGRFGTALGGVRVVITAAEHAAVRPAVFLFNHQSQLDVLVLARLLGGGFTGVAKKELAAVPGVGLMFRLADVAFVDRADTVAARAALEPAVQRLREGLSLVVAPEGTRSTTPVDRPSPGASGLGASGLGTSGPGTSGPGTSRLGPFKKGAFHVALQAGVPVVPVVIHDAGELMPRGAATLRPGTVHVTVLAPIPTVGWSVAALDRHVEEVRRLFLDALRG